MSAIQIGDQLLELPGETSIGLERNSPLLGEEGERGNSSLPLNAPRTPHNDRVLGHPARFDQRRQRTTRWAAELLDGSGSVVLSGSLVLRTITPESYVLNLEFGASEVMQQLKSRKLSSFRFGGAWLMKPAVPPPAPVTYVGVDNTVAYMRETTLAFPARPFLFAPVSNNDANGEWDNYVQWLDAVSGEPKPTPTQHVNFNPWVDDRFAYTVDFVVIGPSKPATVNPLPIIQLAYVVREMFAELKIALDDDFFTDAENQLLVIVPPNAILNQVANPDGPTNAVSNWLLQFRIGDQLPDLTGAELLRALMDSFGLHFDVSSTGRARLRRSAPRIVTSDTTDLTVKVGPGFTHELNTGNQALRVRNRLPENDRYADEFGTQPDPEQVVGEPVATTAQLPIAATADKMVLVRDERRYYKVAQQTDTSTPPVSTYTWEPGPYYAPDVVLTDENSAAENSQDYEIGFCQTIAAKHEYFYGTGYAQVDTLTMLEPSYNPAYATAPRSKNLRLAYFRGMRPVPGYSNSDGTPARIPWLTLSNRDVNGTLIGARTLEVAGPEGLVQKMLRPLLALRRVSGTVKFPSYLSVLEYNRLDFALPVTIRGDQFMLRKASITLPLRKPGQLELVPRRDVEEAT